jgi:hypothetical protein
MSKGRLFYLLEITEKQELKGGAMELYIARDQETKMLIGIFAAKNVSELLAVIGEFTNPLVCEILPLAVGGLIFQKKLSATPPELGDVTISKSWSQRLDDSEEWSKIEESHLEAMRSASSYSHKEGNV